jgi:deoxyadenosine/deoxycytidine kinase
LERLSEAYSYYFFHYRETPLLVVNTDDIDFVNNPADCAALLDQIARCRRGTQVYVPLGSEVTETLPGPTREGPS